VAVQEPARSATADTKATTRGMPSILQGRGVAAEGEHRHSNNVASGFSRTTTEHTG
jgi:hypothetical protein